MISRCRMLACFLFACCFAIRAFALEPLPPKLVVLTFDDSVASQYHIVRPLLKSHGFGATFFITEGFSFRTNKQDYMTWEQIKELHQDGFEIGNHTRDHMGVSKATVSKLTEQVEAINQRCAQYGIPQPVSFAYPGNGITPEALPVLRALGFKFARRGGAPEHPYDWGRGFAFEPGKDHPLLIPSAGDARPDWTLADFKAAVDQARDGKIAVLQFHGAPDREHSWVNTPSERFREYVQYLASSGAKVIALRDLEIYIDPAQAPADPLAIVQQRQALRTEVLVEGEIRDNKGPIPARLSIRGPDGKWFFPRSAANNGSAIRYDKRNGSSIEAHTTLSAHPFRVELVPGRYVFHIEQGKEYFPRELEVEITKGQPKLQFTLQRFVDMASRGWYSGDAHNHRTPSELPNVLLAEGVNVALPMVDWTTDSEVPPTESGRGFPGHFSALPIFADPTHLFYPRNTEYELFRTAGTNHTLGALLILNHKTRFTEPGIPIRAIAAKARAEGALLDLEKHNWPWSIALVPIAGVNLFELGNNHHWQADYAIRGWAVPAPKWMGIQGTGTDSEMGWTLYGFGTYYALLNAGFDLKPSAGTANGVHPVPLGFSRVYVHLDGGFSYQKWIAGLGEGQSFVTTGPMLFADFEGKITGRLQKAIGDQMRISCSFLSQEKLENIELIRNGVIVRSFQPENQTRTDGGFTNTAESTQTIKESCWFAWRCFERRSTSRYRFAHSAPLHVTIPEKPLRPSKAQADWLVQRVKDEIARSEKIVSPALLDEYREALERYEVIAKTARPD